MLSIGHALVGDGKYNPKRRAQLQKEWCPLLFLHAQRLELEGVPGVDGGEGAAVDVTVALTAELEAVLGGMRERE